MIPAEPRAWPASKNSSVGGGKPGAGLLEGAPLICAAVFEALESGLVLLELVVGKQRVFPDAVFVALAEHDVDGIVQDATGQGAAQIGHQDVGFGEMAHGHRQGADMVVMTVGDGDGVQVLAVQQGIKGQGVAAVALGMHSGIQEQAAIVNIHQPGAGADIGGGVQVSNTHGDGPRRGNRAETAITHCNGPCGEINEGRF